MQKGGEVSAYGMSMRILYLSQVLPFPLDAGPKVRAYHVLRYLAGRHRVHPSSGIR